MTQKC